MVDFSEAMQAADIAMKLVNAVKENAVSRNIQLNLKI